jgi:hypothetical protein
MARAENPTVAAVTGAKASSPIHDPRDASRTADRVGSAFCEKSLLRRLVRRRSRWHGVRRFRLGESRHVGGYEVGRDVNRCSDHTKGDDEAYQNTDEKLDHSAGPPAKSQLKLDCADVQSLEA